MRRLTFERGPVADRGRASLSGGDEMRALDGRLIGVSSVGPPLVGEVALENLWMDDDGRVLADGHLMVTEGDLAGQQVAFRDAAVSVARP